jgi:hypothetical protein
VVRHAAVAVVVVQLRHVVHQGPGFLDWRRYSLRRLIATSTPSTGPAPAVMTGAQAENQRCFCQARRHCHSRQSGSSLSTMCCRLKS